MDSRRFDSTSASATAAARRSGRDYTPHRHFKTESQVELVKSIEPSQRREWAKNHVIGEHLFANSVNVENVGRSDARGGDPAAQSVEKAERQDVDQEAACGQVVQLKLSVSSDRQAESGYHGDV